MGEVSQDEGVGDGVNKREQQIREDLERCRRDREIAAAAGVAGEEEGGRVMFHWEVKFTMRGMEPPRPFGKTWRIVCALTRDEAKTKVPAAVGYPVTASKTHQRVSFDQRCNCVAKDEEDKT